MSHPVELAVQVHNPRGDGRRALVLHGLGSDAATTWRLCAALAEAGATAVAPDLRGHGASAPTRRYDLSGYAADVRLLSERWPGPWDLVIGHSLGGAVLAPLLGEPGFARAGLLIDPLLVLDARQAAVLRAGLVAEVGGGLDEQTLRANAPRWDDEDVFRKLRAAERVSVRVVEATLEDNLPLDLVGLADRWPRSVLVLAADPDLDPLVTPDLAQRLRAANRHLTVRACPGAGHSIHRDDPQVVLDALAAVLPDRPAGLTPRR